MTNLVVLHIGVSPVGVSAVWPASTTAVAVSVALPIVAVVAADHNYYKHDHNKGQASQNDTKYSCPTKSLV